MFLPIKRHADGDLPQSERPCNKRPTLQPASSARICLPPDIFRHLFTWVPVEMRPLLRETCRFFSQEIKDTVSPRLVMAAARSGNIFILGWFKSRKAYFDQEVCAAAAAGGQLKALMWLRENGAIWNTLTVKAAAEGGHLPLVRWLLQTDAPCNPKALSKSAGAKSSETFRFIQRMGLFEKGSALESASRHGRMELLKELSRDMANPAGERIKVQCIHAAAAHGQMEVLEHFIPEGSVWPDGLATAAASQGHFTQVKNLLKAGAPFNPYVWMWAGKFADLPMIAWLTEKGYSPDSSLICQGFILGKHVDLLKTHCTDKFPWNSQHIQHAAEMGFLEVIQSARAANCPWFEDEAQMERKMEHGWAETPFTCAALNGHLPVLQWLHANGYPYDNREWEHAIQWAAHNNHKLTLEWLMLQGIALNDGCTDYAAAQGRLDLLIWLLEKGCPWHEDIPERAAQYGKLPILKWAVLQGYPWNAQTCARLAIENGELDVLKWILENGQGLKPKSLIGLLCHNGFHNWLKHHGPLLKFSGVFPTHPSFDSSDEASV